MTFLVTLAHFADKWEKLGQTYQFDDETMKGKFDYVESILSMPEPASRGKARGAVETSLEILMIVATTVRGVHGKCVVFD